MDKFLDTYNLPRLNHEDKENLNRSIMNKLTESVIKNLPKKKARTKYLSLGNTTKCLKKN